MSRKTKKKAEIPYLVLTNEITEFKANNLKMFYKAAALKQLAYMDGKDPVTGEIVPLLVGLEPTENATQFKVYPLARLISKASEIINYMVPDGTGGYFADAPDVGPDGFADTELDESIELASPEEEGPAS